MKLHLFLAGSFVVALSAGTALASGAPITANPFPAQGPLPDVSLRPTLSPPSFGPSLFSGPPPSWTGAYFGANAGYIADGGSAANVGAFPIGYGAFPSDIAVLSGDPTPNDASFIGGGQFGYNLQMSILDEL